MKRIKQLRDEMLAAAEKKFPTIQLQSLNVDGTVRTIMEARFNGIFDRRCNLRKWVLDWVTDNHDRGREVKFIVMDG
jgi:hypothetical protein